MMSLEERLSHTEGEDLYVRVKECQPAKPKDQGIYLICTTTGKKSEMRFLEIDDSFRPIEKPRENERRIVIENVAWWFSI